MEKTVAEVQHKDSTVYCSDPERSRLRQIHRLKRREYLNPGPNYWWHADRYDKLKPYSFPVHGCIDGFSRRILWLKLTKSNNDPRIICDFLLNAILERDGCPALIRTDRDTENGIMATASVFLAEMALTHNQV